MLLIIKIHGYFFKINFEMFNRPTSSDRFMFQL